MLIRNHRSPNLDGGSGGSRRPSDRAAELAVPLDVKLQTNLDRIGRTLGHSPDILVRHLVIGQEEGKAALLYTDRLADAQAISDFVVESVMTHIQPDAAPEGPGLTALLRNKALAFGDVKDIADYGSLYNALLSGDAIVMVDGDAIALAAGTRKWKNRGVTEPATENVVRGPRESFSESIRTNAALVRRKIKDPNLWLEGMRVGRVTQTDVAIMYIRNIANDKIVDEVRKRLARIDIDAVLESGYIEEMIQDSTLSPFPTIYNTERPDVVAAELLEGKIAILVDGTPFVLVVPALFVSFLHAAEDYYHRADISSFVRLLRYIGVFVSLLGPSLYVAITTFHQEMLPTQLLIGLAAQREDVPFPAFVEAVLMELTFEILREAGVRMPKYIGAAVSIVGTLVIGQAAVEAGIISAAMVIVVAITAISSFVLPAYNMSIAFRMLRFPFMGLAASFGLLGIFVGAVALMIHLSGLRSFGVPYMAPLAPIVPEGIKDSLARFPHWLLLSRPTTTSRKNKIRGIGHPPRRSRD